MTLIKNTFLSIKYLKSIQVKMKDNYEYYTISIIYCGNILIDWIVLSVM